MPSFKGRHSILFILLGWVIALIVPPQALLGMFNGNG